MRISDWSSDVCSSDLHEIDVLDIAAVGLDAGTFRQLDHLHAVMLRRRGLLADIGHAGETGLVPDRHAIAIAHQMLRQFALAEVAAVGGERNELVGPGAGAEPACRLRSEERRVGKGWVRTCRSRGSPFR